MTEQEYRFKMKRLGLFWGTVVTVAFVAGAIFIENNRAWYVTQSIWFAGMTAVIAYMYRKKS